MLAPVTLLAVVIAVVAPQDDDRVVGVGARRERVEDAAHHRVGIAHACEVAVNRVLDGAELLELPVNA